MASEGSTELQRTLRLKGEIEDKVRRSLRLEIPSPLKGDVVDMLLDLEERRVPQVRVVELDGEVYFLVAAMDWPGLSDASLAVIHDKGYNLSMLFGIQIEDTPYSVVIMKIAEMGEMDRERLKRDREEMVSLLRTVAKGGLDIRTLLGAEGRKLRVYDRVLKEIDRMVAEGKMSERMKAKIVGEDGELIKFIRSRTVAYLEERSPRTLAEIVKMQVELAEKAREKPDNVFVGYHIFKVGPEHKRDQTMIGFTVVGRSGLVKLSDVLHIFRGQGIVERYRKEFILPDGIAVVRVEIDGTYQHRIMSLRAELQNLTDTQEGEDEIAPGEEIFGRMVSDRLIREYEESGVPQLLTMRMNKNIYRASAVGPLLGETEGEAEDRLEEVFREHRFTVQEAIVKSLKGKDRKIGLYVLKLQPNVPMRHVHDKVKGVFISLFGKVRDFDESLRKINYRKLTTLYEILAENVPRKFIGSIFYSLKDELRIMEPTEVIARIISHIFSSVEAFLEESEKKNRKQQPNKATYSTTVSRYLVTSVVSRQPLSKEEREELQERYGERVSRLNIYGNEVQTFVKRLPKDESQAK